MKMLKILKKLTPKFFSKVLLSSARMQLSGSVWQPQSLLRNLGFFGGKLKNDYKKDHCYLLEISGQIQKAGSGRCTNLQKPRLYGMCGMWQSPDLYLLRACFILFVDLIFYDLSPQ